ncbi:MULTISPECIES: hypothetical protein [Corynebacterium]|uniref:hypothetical protein n=1 Tax=Corynebacterium TaxID=1716 RepID=UPI00264A5173|nr:MULTISPECIES: hypothetical protein [Corynebacterium]MDN8624403.1 hypothetical protein [Corynebacterium kroppenstedtii]
MSAPVVPQQSSWAAVPESDVGGPSDRGHEGGERHFVVSIIGPDVAALPRVAGVVEAAVRGGFPGDPKNVTWDVAIAAGPEVQPDVVVAMVPPATHAIIPDKDRRILEAVRRAVDHVVILSAAEGPLSENSAGALFFPGDGKQLPRNWDGIPICYSDYELMTVCHRCAQELVASSTAADSGISSGNSEVDSGADSSDRGPAVDDVEEYYTLTVPSSGVSTPSSATTAVLSDIGVVRVPEKKLTYDVSSHVLLPSSTLRNWLHTEEKQRRDSMAVTNQHCRAMMDRAVQDAYRSASSAWRSCLDPKELPEIIDAATDQLNDDRPAGTEPVPYIDVPFDPPEASVTERILIISVGISLGLGVARMVVMPLVGTAFGVSISLGIAFGLFCAIVVSYMRHQQLQNNFRRVGGADALSLARDQWVDHARRVTSHAEEKRVKRLRSGGLRTVALQEALAHMEMASSRPGVSRSGIARPGGK